MSIHKKRPVWGPIDAIAIVVVIGAFILIFYSRDGIVSGALSLIVGYYFGRRSSGPPVVVHSPDTPVGDSTGDRERPQ